MGMNLFITTQGFSKISMMTTVIGAVINIILDPIFIFVFGMGVKGAALATVLSQAVGAIWILRFLTGPKTILRLRKKNLRLEKRYVVPCLALGVSTFVMLSTESLLSISFTSSLSRYGGDLAVGAMTIITSVSQLVSMPLQGICQGGQPIISYNFGARNNNRVKKAFFTQFGVCITGFTTILLRFFLPLAHADFRRASFPSDPNTDRIYGMVSVASIWIRLSLSLGFQLACQPSFLGAGPGKDLPASWPACVS